jgi:hypothetical protein
MAGKNRDQRIELLQKKLDELKKIHYTKARLQVAVCAATKRDIDPIFRNRDGGPVLVREAEKMTVIQALRYLSKEDDSIVTEGKYAGRDQAPTVVVSPSPELLERAQRFMVSPHLLIRAAAVKIARRMKWMDERGRKGEYIQALKAGVELSGEAPPD